MKRLSQKEHLSKLLQIYNIHPKKSFGQNFLIDEEVISYIANLFTNKDTIIEIGPGIGSLTIPLSHVVKKLTAVEIDEQLATLLPVFVGEDANISVIIQDILNYVPSYEAYKYKMVGALPYNISKKIVRQVIELPNPPSEAYFILQKEVGEDYIYRPPFTSLAITTVGLADIKEHLIINPESFYPAPGVKSILIEIRLKELSLKEKKRRLIISHFAKTAFINPRKQLVNVLPSISKRTKPELQELFKKNNISINSRAEELKYETWEKIYNALKEAPID